ncbi:hypothetical protein A3D84_05315 [Candidatus Woesebacteria bacterium RIFCSPHIGHO2_02_FULL_42_20]|uniref:Uncharacterized protein n=1 Tax=Candidatus Woesebacteria bacterium RIFCSPHIGHO2_12_FULL_41_24 TaxID=1802510 RepID=A0A1F8APU4_9BACT|nr:MAG: hypothetical protein A2W15_04695 [Candidatus Woesebacteria bacterium RBG_16_41_13]OGM30597.1 MAG: hypothetical protein A2873_00590 [Candidatus Woesebacteria bacterium RIFCSPHIGHO2_01_FULL_42_80]OGM34609.1 MAG: hypothetical protein A3D84_05315 [Candidatus Woesebacteria bacterium RIFCSPHIGHO2_02_FULL_42_20]OGM53793.1 MAG: hypothetical protein A3E44_05240 [Candidatus Woesebacteria bacterium RIFCSPHIGHO2_12_FULL_41_24]OGM65985.1 MAG: hypothetical protein A2969_03335 [Candidatus Woesebacteri
MKEVVLVTGSSSGLGQEITLFLSKKDFVVYGGSRTETEIDGVKWLKLDITSDKSCKEAVHEIIKKEGKIDVLINNAGYALSGPFEKFSSYDYLKILDTNAVGAFRLIKEVLVNMKSRGGGKIINITSLSGLVSFPNFSVYSASKFAFQAFSESIRYELLKDNINITVVAPGAIYSEEKVKLQHKSARQKLWPLRLLLPFVRGEKIVQKIYEIIKMDRPPVITVVGRDAKIIWVLNRLLPRALWDKLQKFIWNK